MRLTMAMMVSLGLCGALLPACGVGRVQPGAYCGDGLVNPDREQCDAGDDNADNAACTLDCRLATCGDQLVWADQEECDDGPEGSPACTRSCREIAPTPQSG